MEHFVHVLFHGGLDGADDAVNAVVKVSAPDNEVVERLAVGLVDGDDGYGGVLLGINSVDEEVFYPLEVGISALHI